MREPTNITALWIKEIEVVQKAFNALMVYLAPISKTENFSKPMIFAFFEKGAIGYIGNTRMDSPDTEEHDI